MQGWATDLAFVIRPKLQTIFVDRARRLAVSVRVHPINSAGAIQRRVVHCRGWNVHRRGWSLFEFQNSIAQNADIPGGSDNGTSSQAELSR
ncbi:hypothetical protein THAOC_24232, partial [Thalassiosira oceanica]